MFRTLLVVVVATAILLGLTVPTLALGWAPMLHWKCTTGTKIGTEYAFLPEALVNSPYGGAANGTGSPKQAGYPGGLGGGTGSLNGTVGVAFFAVNLSLFTLVNVTAWGPGTNTRCSQPMVVIPSAPPGGGLVSAGAGVPVPSNQSDQDEATTVNVSGFAGSPVAPIWDNGFHSANEPSLSTCDASAVHTSVAAPGPQLLIPFNDSGVVREVPYTLPFWEHYTYFFPADFGSWAIDNLSSPGGPGGGWAFDFLGACA